MSLGSGCTRPADTCNDIASHICARLEECGARDRVFTGEQQCRASFNGLFEVFNNDDAQCREFWDVVKDRDCAAFLEYFNI